MSLVQGVAWASEPLEVTQVILVCSSLWTTELVHIEGLKPCLAPTMI